MLSLVDRVRRTLQRHGLCPPGSRVIVALSGGADSVALTLLLSELAPEEKFALVGVAHLNHRLRGQAADADEAFCRELAVRLALPISVEHSDVQALAKERRMSIEEAGREARYAFLGRAAMELGASRIAVGHTLDDQAETFLLNLVRGAGPRGLAGIHPRLGAIVRPLLDVRHAELRGYLADRGIAFREDETNADTTMLRNRVRHLLIPFLERHFSPGVATVLAREAAIARDDAAWLDAESDRAWGRIADAADKVGGVDLDMAGLAEVAPAIARRIALRALAACSGGRFVGFDHVEALLALATGAPGQSACDLPGLRAERVGERLRLRSWRVSRRSRAVQANFFRYPLSIPGEARVAEAGCTITSETASRPAAGWPAGFVQGEVELTATVDAASLPPLLHVRSWRPGDRFRPLGLAGHKKLQDFFMDRKIARADRGRTPLVVDDRDRIVWVAGQATADDFRVTADTEAVVILRLENWGDRA